VNVFTPRGTALHKNEAGGDRASAVEFTFAPSAIVLVHARSTGPSTSKSPEKFTVIRYEGYDLFGGLKKKQEFIDISASNPVQREDICLPRGETGTTFPHVCMVYAPPDGSGAFTTIDGNQTGAYRPEGASQECIGINSHDANKKMKSGKTYKFAFVHVKDL
jgi:hypothetical protein